LLPNTPERRSAASTITLIDEDRQWFKAKYGMPEETAPIELSLCAHAILDEDITEIPDTLDDSRTADNPLCNSGPECRFYAAVPLVGKQGLPLGTLCVLGFQPKMLTGLQRDTLRVLGNHVMKLLELRKALSIEIALRHEVDHRVKNSLQSVISMTGLMKSGATSDETKSALDVISRHILSTAALHSLIYKSEEEGQIALGALLNEISDLIKSSVPKNIEFALTADDIIVTTKTASRVLLVINEFTTNSMKHAFPNNMYGKISVTGVLGEDGVYILTCKDNGVGTAGITQREIEEKKGQPKGLGLKIFKAAAAQVSGNLIFNPDGPNKETGFSLIMEFPVEKHGKNAY